MARHPVQALQDNYSPDRPFPSYITIPAKRTMPNVWWGKGWLMAVLAAYNFLSKWVTVRVPLDMVDYSTWVAYGQMRGWVSNHFCDTHDDVPMTAEESEAYLGHECGEDDCDDTDLPCIIGLRVWTDWI